MIPRFAPARVATLALVAIILALAGCTAPKPAQLAPAQKMVQLAKPAVVRPVTIIEITWVFRDDAVANAVGQNPYTMPLTSTGSGWFIHPDGYVVTNAHVAQYAQLKEAELIDQVLFPRLIKLIEARLGGRLSQSDLDRVIRATTYGNFKRQFFVLTPGGDALGAEIKSFGVPYGQDVSGKDVAILKVEGRNFPTLPIGNSDEVKLQDKVYIMGYPGVADDATFDIKAILESSVSDGAVQAKKNTQQGTPVIQVGGAANHGNSGGPVALENGQVVGILTFGQTENVNFIVPMNTIMEFVRQAGASAQNSVINDRYREAMTLYWDGKYSKAVGKFEEILRMYPTHMEARKFLADAEARRKDEPPIDLSDPVVMGAIGGGALVLVILAVFLVMRSGRKGATPAPAGAGAPARAAGGTGGGAPLAPGARPVTPLQPSTAPIAAAPVTATSGSGSAGTAVLGSAVGYARFSAGPLAGQRLEVPSDGLILGRDPGPGGVAVPDSRVSRQHCWIGPNPTGTGVVIMDRGSTNGTFVNSISAGRVQQVQLKPGDRVFLGGDGGVAFTFES